MLDIFDSDPLKRVELALEAFRAGKGALVVDNENRENEGDIIFPAETITEAQVAMMIRYCSGIICVCMPGSRLERLELPQMVKNNTSSYGTAFTITIEASKGVTTGVSAHEGRHQSRCRPLRSEPSGTCVPSGRPGRRRAGKRRPYRGLSGSG